MPKNSKSFYYEFSGYEFWVLVVQYDNGWIFEVQFLDNGRSLPPLRPAVGCYPTLEEARLAGYGYAKEVIADS